ncbi:oxygenase MpaB family protein [Aeromicrobium sp. Leaf350]|uniref:oxygenase MpaB family protein n=1 Tax=Aeromicrobium sp. Leaf350 TaxID=2876565 RepID=UPI001E447663|nr:oxygenase MpaB family protein [Aeromicrobium sp. Leaf350]
MRLPLRRDHWEREIDRLDPVTDRLRITQILSMHEFPWDLQQALSFALFRTYAVPSIGRLLFDTGQFTVDTQRRHDDTVLILEGIVEHGPDSPEGRQSVRRMNQMHGSYDISNDDMRYVLATFVVMPVRWVDDFGYRRLRGHEVEATVEYYKRVGALMGIKDLPADYAGFSRLLDVYETEHFTPDRKTRAVADATLDLLTSFYPRPLAPAVDLFARSLMDDHLLAAFGYRKPPALARWATRRALRLRAWAIARMPARRSPTYARDLARVKSYPNGHLVARLGTFPDTMPSDEEIAARSA